MKTVTDFIFLGSKITANGGCSHEIKRCLLLGRKAMTNIDGILKSRNITLPMKVCLVKAFLSRSKCLLTLWLQSPSTVIWEPRKIKSVTVSIFFPSIFHEVMGLGAMILVFWMLSFKPVFSLSSFTFIKKLFSSSSLSAIRVVWSAYLRLLLFLLAILILVCASSSLAFCIWCTLHIS